MTEAHLVVRLGEIRVARDEGVLAALGLGSCVAVALYDPVARIGALTHAMLPDPTAGRRQSPPGRFVASAVPLAIAAIEESGGVRTRLAARMVGGAAMFEALAASGNRTLGERNVVAARQALAAAGVPLAGEAVGGGYGRSVFFDVQDGRLVVTSVLRPDVVL